MFGSVVKIIFKNDFYSEIYKNDKKNIFDIETLKWSKNIKKKIKILIFNIDVKF